jgi:two-component system, cell cycle sensor histidine kinase and response regulator CckA
MLPGSVGLIAHINFGWKRVMDTLSFSGQRESPTISRNSNKLGDDSINAAERLHWPFQCQEPMTTPKSTFELVERTGQSSGPLEPLLSESETTDSQMPQATVYIGNGKSEKSSLAERSLRNSELRYRRLFEAAQDGILILDATTGLITDVNPFLINLLGYSKDELMGKALWEIGLFKDIETSKTAVRELQIDGYKRYENLPLKTKSGRSIHVEVVSNVYCEHNKNVIQCNVRDISLRINAEFLEQRLIQSQKMEAVGQLAGGLAHDFNNLLGVILGYCEILEERADLPEDARAMVKGIHQAGSSGKNLTQRLLAFGRQQVLQPITLDLNDTVSHTVVMLGRLIGDDVQLVSVLGSSLGKIEADPSQIEQVLMNLAINARDAMPKGGKISIETSNQDISDMDAEEDAFLKPGRYVTLTVTDSGIGMDQKTQSHIFEPFFSTKALGRGTGLGLSTVFGIVRQSGGTISVVSEPGHGATFTIHFPRSDKAPAFVEPKRPSPSPRGSETILLVDDSNPLRELTRLLLETGGYTVIDSGDPAEALRMAERHKGALPLMITDVDMPGFSGPVLAEKLTAIRPETRVLFVSGYADGKFPEHGQQGQASGFLGKPFTRGDLLKKVRELLDVQLVATQ